MRKKILFFTAITPSFKSCLDEQMEILLNHYYNGDKVYIVIMGDSDLVEFLAGENRLGSFVQRVSYREFVKYITDRFGRKFSFLNYKPSLVSEQDVPYFKDVDDLKLYNVNNIPIGLSCASSLISEIRDHKFNTELYRDDVVQRLIFASVVLNTASTYINELQPDLVYVFNGRGFTTGPIVQYCKSCNIEFRTYEISNNKNKYDLIENTIPHNINFRDNQINELWRDINVEQNQKVKLAQAFYESNRVGKPLVGINFTDLQKEEEILNIDNTKEIITFFNSSIDEYAAVPGWENYIFLFEDEVDAIVQICNYFKNDNSKQFVLRIHPNLKNLDNTQTRNFEKLRFIENLIVFEATHSISTYQLIDISSKIITFGSTVGIEATYLEKPSISLGLSFYMYQDVVYIPKDKQELYQLIHKQDLTPKPKENTYPYGYWIQSFGVSFTHRGKDFPEKLFSLKGVNKLVYWVIVLFSKDFLLKLKSSKYRKYIFNKYFLRKFQK